MTQINYSNLENFWKWLVEGYPEDAFTEIRLMSIKDDRIYAVVQKFSTENPGIIMRKNSQFFINKYDDLVKILDYKNNIFMRYTKICYSINPKFFKNNEISGGYDNIRTQNKIFFDIEKKDHSALSDIERDRIEYKYLTETIAFLKRYNLIYPTIVRSGNGLHLIYKIRPMEVTEGRKEAYKEFINTISDKLQNDIFHIDIVVDATRTVALPETINPKNGFKVHYTILGNENDFFIKAKKIRKKKAKPIQQKSIEGMEVRKSLAWKILTTQGTPAGGRNNILVFYLKLLIRDIDEDHREYERELNSIYHDGWHMSSLQGIQGKIRNFGAIINWCKQNEPWCKENNIDYKEYKY